MKEVKRLRENKRKKSRKVEFQFITTTDLKFSCVRYFAFPGQRKVIEIK